MIILFYTLIAIGLTVILIYPYWGIILLFVSIALTETLYDFPFLNSVFPVWGLATVLGFILKNLRARSEYTIRFEWVYVFVILFIIWIFISNPIAGQNAGNRSWTLTFIQLLVLTFLTGTIMNKKEKFHSLMFWFSLALAGSAIYGIAYTSLESTRMGSEIEAGLLGGKNTAARYYTVASLFTFYLLRISSSKFNKLLLWTVLVILIVGVLFTLSRTGLGLLLFAALIVITRYKKYSIKQIIPTALFIFIILILLPDTLYDTYFSVITGQEFQTGGRGAEYSSVEKNIRYTLWFSGVQMWKTAPITGVGIGQFSANVSSYLPFSLAYLNLGAHNMFIQLLAETGAVGFLLYTGVLASTYFNFRKSATSDQDLNSIWMIAFLVMLVGGLMKHDHYDKLLWLLLGSSIAFKNYLGKIISNDEG